MTSPGLALLDSPRRLASALPALRRRLLERLRTPASASELAREFGMPRQRLNYHLRVLEEQDLVELVELRPRRGFTERVLRTVGEAFVVDPAVLLVTEVAPVAAAPAQPRRARASGRLLRRDRFAAEHLVDVAGSAVRNVARMSGEAGRRQQRLLTFTLETAVRFATPADVHRFTDELAVAVAEVTARFDRADGRPYRLFAAGHPAAGADAEPETGPGIDDGAPTVAETGAPRPIRGDAG